MRSSGEEVRCRILVKTVVAAVFVGDAFEKPGGFANVTVLRVNQRQAELIGVRLLLTAEST